MNWARASDVWPNLHVLHAVKRLISREQNFVDFGFSKGIWGFLLKSF